MWSRLGEWDLWANPDVLQKLPAALPRERIVSGAPC
jgi:hypothetical protein